MEALLKLPEVRRRTSLAKSTIYKMMAEGKFPANIQTVGRSRAWPESIIEGWIQNRILSGTKDKAA